MYKNNFSNFYTNAEKCTTQPGYSVKMITIYPIHPSIPPLVSHAKVYSVRLYHCHRHYYDITTNPVCSGGSGKSR